MGSKLLQKRSERLKNEQLNPSIESHKETTAWPKL